MISSAVAMASPPQQQQQQQQRRAEAEQRRRAGGFDPLTLFRRNYTETLSQLQSLSAATTPPGTQPGTGTGTGTPTVCWPWVFDGTTTTI